MNGRKLLRQDLLSIYCVLDTVIYAESNSEQTTKIKALMELTLQEGDRFLKIVHSPATEG